MTIIINKSSSEAAVDSARIELSNVDFSYAQAPVFRGLSLSVTPGAITAVVGSNGAGKSTLLALLAGVSVPDSGTVHVSVGEVAFAVQRSQVTDTFPITTAEAVMMGRWRRLGLVRRPTAADRAVVEHWLTALGLTGLRRRTLGELSGGQRQRVLLAQAFAQEAPLLLLDEPTTGLDSSSRSQVIAHLRSLADAGTTVVAATHDADVAGAADHRIDLDKDIDGAGTH
ncbi:putative ABC transporter ATP-binding protein [Mycolicibacterium vanbaalenii]|uniref:Putative ABC transporter ATP-binding protein n=1 Tax=Mycolicibacterium vanbaalenii TaxID=110539 RepID=A0A5S9MW69_MYCVN|nr:zinc ABC transporter ATP-binding protein AztA [Mycolicibacterium vanbaalenii]CAA0080951.1 putative ABC transporter ATP-binding protein [Mycolicibacterium vanbaalenii]